MIEFVGYLASALVLCTFCTKTMVPLRVFAIASNVAFVGYAAVLDLHPILVLHTVLLPLNAWRLCQILGLAALVRRHARESRIFAALAPVASRVRIREGEVVIRKGDRSDALYLVVEGTLRVLEVGVTIRPGTVIGEIGVLSSTGARTATVTALSDCVLGRIPARDFRRLYHADPGLGLRLVRLIIDRLSTEIEARRRAASEAVTEWPT
jgi:CRP/FNR family transcriptional regulator, cyclic AMP receptor protein